MENDINKRVCPVEIAGSLDNRFRRLIQNPARMLKPYITEGMIVLDLGCGPGFFSIEMAKLINGSGKVIAADLQEGMLEKVNNKIAGTNIEQYIKLHKCGENKIGLTEKVDFVLACYMVHEVPDQENLFLELKSILNPGGKIYIIEPPFHVSKKAFEKMAEMLTNIGFEITERPKTLFGRSLTITHNKA